MEAEQFHVDGRKDRDMTKPTLAFRNFENAPKNLKKKTSDYRGNAREARYNDE